jgi:hypothetical protein
MMSKAEQPKVMNSPIIKAWAKKHPTKAKELGLRLIQNRQAPDALEEMPSLGEFQDRAQEWAIDHPTRAKVLILSMMKDFVK